MYIHVFYVHMCILVACWGQKRWVWSPGIGVIGGVSHHMGAGYATSAQLCYKDHKTEIPLLSTTEMGKIEILSLSITAMWRIEILSLSITEMGRIESSSLSITETEKSGSLVSKFPMNWTCFRPSSHSESSWRDIEMFQGSTITDKVSPVTNPLLAFRD